MPADPDRQLHANRAHSIPTADGTRNCFSRGDILEGRTPAAWGSEQSAEVAVTGQQEDNPDTWTKRWYAKGRVLRVPKAVVLSSMPQWTLYWPKSYFYMNRDVIGDDGFGGLGNYYYLDQWNGLDPATSAVPDYGWTSRPDASQDDDEYKNQDVWSDFKFLDPGDKSTVYNAKMSCILESESGNDHCEDIPSWLLNLCQEPPKEERYQVQVGVAENPYYQIHPKLLDAFLGAKAILENDPKDPILVSIPNWMPRHLRQVRNSFLKRTHEKLNASHGGSVNKQPCTVFDAVPCYTTVPKCWAPPYPDSESPVHKMGFRGPGVPWLLNASPGFGTNALHLYVGHPNMAYFATDTIFGYQAWPLTPEVQWILGPVFSGNYVGSGLPFFAGRRLIWRAFGFDYGYVNHGAQGLWDSRYSVIVGGAADSYKENFWKFRDHGTRIFTYDPRWNFQWDFDHLDKDRRNTCPSTLFYFGSDFAEYAGNYNDDDNTINDCAGSREDHLKVGETTNFFPRRAEMERAKQIGRSLTRRVEEYYTKNDAGSAEFFQLAVDRTGLADYNVKYEGTMPGALATAGGIVDYVREYFQDHR